MARTTLASTNARIDALESKIDSILTLLEANAPAKRTPARKSAPKPKASTTKAPKVTKGAQTRETLPRSQWNRTLTAKARLAGGDTYARVLADWTKVQSLRETHTPDQVLALYAR